MSKGTRWLAIFGALVLMASACGDDDDGDVGNGGDNGAGARDSIVIAIGDEPSTLDPQATEDGNERAVTDNIYDTLLRRDTETNDLVPHLATALPTQVDDTTWEFTLREGVTFTNGEQFDAEAAAYSVNRVIDPEYNSAQVDFYAGISGAEAIDETTLHVFTEGFDPVFPARMYRLKMVPPEYSSSQEAEFTENPIGTGPYEFVRWQRGNRVELVRNESYWGDPPSIANVTIRFISEAGTRAAGLQRDEIQLATLIPPELADNLPQVLSVEGLEFPVYRLKNYEGVLEDPRVRQAMNLAVNKEELANDLFSGFASVAECQTLSSVHFGYNPDLEPYDYDPDRARQLLEEAGYGGEEVELLGATGRWLKDAEMTESVITFLTDVGFNVAPDIRPFSSYIDEFAVGVGNPQPDVGFVAASNELFDASKIDSYYHEDGALSSYVNADVTVNLDQALTEADTDERERLYHETTRIGCEDDPVFIFTLNLQDIYGAVADLDWQPRVDGSVYVPEMSLG